MTAGQNGSERPPWDPRPDSAELRAELLGLAAMRLATAGPEGLAGTIYSHLLVVERWPDAAARTRAEQVTAEIGQWPDGQVMAYSRAWHAAEAERSRRAGPELSGRRWRPGLPLPGVDGPGRAQIEEAWQAEVALQARSLALRSAAQRELDAQAWQPPEVTGDLAAGLARPRTGEPHRIPGYAGWSHNVLLAGPRKTGKTQLLANLSGSLSKSGWVAELPPPAPRRLVAAPFLGLSQCFLSGSVAYVNLEMDEQDWLDVFRAMPAWAYSAARIFPLHRRGLPLPVITSAAARDWFVTWLRERQIEVLIIDTWGQFCARNGVRRMNDDGDVLPVLTGLDGIKAEAGVASLYVSIHMPHQTGESHLERFKGAGATGDWADTLWTFTADAEAGIRYLGAVGRSRIDRQETALEFDAGTGLLSLDIATGTRVQAKAGRQEARILAALDEAGSEGMLTEALVTAAGGHVPTAREIVAKLVKAGTVEIETKGRAKTHRLRQAGGTGTSTRHEDEGEQQQS